MKKLSLLVFLLVFWVSVSVAKTYDTSFSASLYGKVKSKVSVSFEYNKKEKFLNGAFELKIDNLSIKNSFNDSYVEMGALVIDIDKKDDYKEIAVACFSDLNTGYMIYRYNGKEITYLGEVFSDAKPVIPGDGTIKAEKWMGFWECDFDFIFNKDKKLFEPAFNDEYPMKYYEGYDKQIVVLYPFSTYKERDKNSVVVTNFVKDDVVKILKAYIKTNIEVDDNIEYYYWYLLEDKNGNKGWIQLRDFMEKVDGMPWTG